LEKVKLKGQRVKVMVPMTGLAKRNTHVKYESPSTYQSKVMTKVKFLEKKVKGKSVKVMVSNEGSCQKEYTCKI
jgi:hypothetical protein